LHSKLNKPIIACQNGSQQKTSGSFIPHLFEGKAVFNSSAKKFNDFSAAQAHT
jgi:hypothetical protein